MDFSDIFSLISGLTAAGWAPSGRPLGFVRTHFRFLCRNASLPLFSEIISGNFPHHYPSKQALDFA